MHKGLEILSVSKTHSAMVLFHVVLFFLKKPPSFKMAAGHLHHVALKGIFNSTKKRGMKYSIPQKQKPLSKKSALPSTGTFYSVLEACTTGYTRIYPVVLKSKCSKPTLRENTLFGEIKTALKNKLQVPTSLFLDLYIP